MIIEQVYMFNEGISVWVARGTVRGRKIIVEGYTRKEAMFAYASVAYSEWQ